MIGGGNWNRQNKILNGVYINFISKSTKGTSINKPIEPNHPVNPSVGFLWLKDVNGLLFNTSDGFNLVVRK